MGLFDLLKKGAKAKEVPQRTRSQFGEPLDRLDADGNLPHGWHYANREFTEKIRSEYEYFSGTLLSAKRESVRAEYNALASLVQYMEDVQNLCASKGECFTKWASSSVANPTALADYREQLEYMTENLPELLEKEEIIRQLRSNLTYLISSEPGVLQSDLYKRFDPSTKLFISNELYQMAAHNEIVREKSGRSYKLYMK